MFPLYYLFVLLFIIHQAVSSPSFTPQSPLLQDPFPEPQSACNCSGTKPGWHEGYICTDERLGPVQLPRIMPMLSFINNYDRFGKLTPGAFLEKWTLPENGKWRYPPFDGYALDVKGKPISGTITLAVGTKVDRFGEESGTSST